MWRCDDAVARCRMGHDGASTSILRPVRMDAFHCPVSHSGRQLVSTVDPPR